MKSIIIIDDDPFLLEAIQLIFPKKDYQVRLFNSGKFLLEGHYEIPDIFILDKQLSGIDGLALCIYLKKQANTEDIPVILLSASPHIHRLAKNAGADGSLEKPFNIVELRAMVEQLVSRV